MTEKQPQHTPPRTFFLMILNLLGLAISLSLVITIMLYGWGILQAGFQLAIEAIWIQEYSLLMHPPCSCAIAEVFLLILGMLGTVVTFPRVIRFMKTFRQQQLEKQQKSQVANEPQAK